MLLAFYFKSFQITISTYSQFQLFGIMDCCHKKMGLLITLGETDTKLRTRLPILSIVFVDCKSQEKTQIDLSQKWRHFVKYNLLFGTLKRLT